MHGATGEWQDITSSVVSGMHFKGWPMQRGTHRVALSVMAQCSFSNQTWVPADDFDGGAAVPMPALGFARPGHADQVLSSSSDEMP